MQEKNRSLIWIAVFGAFFVVGQTAVLIDETTPANFSGDQINIVSICMILDAPQSYSADLLGQKPANLEYYIPVYVAILRHAKTISGSYVAAHKVLLAITSMLFVTGWFLLFCRFTTPVYAVLLAFVIRGIMWPPGNELWGIGPIWTMIPRTLFTAILPWSLLPFAFRKELKQVVASGLLIGVATNIHPVSGVGVAGVFAVVVLVTFADEGFFTALRNGTIAFLSSITAMLPYILVFLKHGSSTGKLSPEMIEEVVSYRIKSQFLDPLLYLTEWLDFKWMILILSPFLVLFLCRKRLADDAVKRLYILFAAVVAIMLVAVIPTYFQQLANYVGLNLNVGFQLIRNGKFVIVPAFLCWGLLTSQLKELVGMCRQTLEPIGALILVVACISAQLPFLRSVPLIGDDILRAAWPVSLNLLFPIEDIHKAEELVDWVKSNTDQNDLMVGPRLLRIYPGRQVVHDMSGAVLLIESDLALFHKTVKRDIALDRAVSDNERRELMQSWGANVFVTQTRLEGVDVVFSNHRWNVYRLNEHPILDQ